MFDGITGKAEKIIRSFLDVCSSRRAISRARLATSFVIRTTSFLEDTAVTRDRSEGSWNFRNEHKVEPPESIILFFQ